jgi:hypothetical protein
MKMMILKLLGDLCHMITNELGVHKTKKIINYCRWKEIAVKCRSKLSKFRFKMIGKEGRSILIKNLCIQIFLVKKH